MSSLLRNGGGGGGAAATTTTNDTAAIGSSTVNECEHPPLSEENVYVEPVELIRVDVDANTNNRPEPEYPENRLSTNTYVDMEANLLQAEPADTNEDHVVLRYDPWGKLR